VVLARDAAAAAANREIAASLESHWARITTGAGKSSERSGT
jgi:hypothetical protein